jgi:hypothetical protein
MPDRFTERQGQYLAFIDSYVTMYGQAPAEADLREFFQTTPPTVHQMILKLEEKGLISRVPGEARSIKLLLGRKEIPQLKRPQRKHGTRLGIFPDRDLEGQAHGQANGSSIGGLLGTNRPFRPPDRSGRLEPVAWTQS